MNNRIIGDINRIEECLVTMNNFQAAIRANLDSLKRELSKQAEPFKIEPGDVKLRDGRKATVVVTDADTECAIQGYYIDDKKLLSELSWKTNGSYYECGVQDAFDITGKWED